ncbi:MAG TPA: hypothetical protein VIA06_10440 [Candidatus Dormibacteraeota bacterium]|jgi:hypothetical protein|nr:hypothetical protein [Candidatus Dormibacteraeota bacterium]
MSGGRWAGKTTVADILARRHDLVAHHHDLHDARAHSDRRIARRAERGDPLEGPDPEQAWVQSTPEERVAGFPERFEWALDDLRAQVSGRPVSAEGWGLRPELVALCWTRPARWWCWCRPRISGAGS